MLLLQGRLAPPQARLLHSPAHTQQQEQAQQRAYQQKEKGARQQERRHLEAGRAQP